MPPISILCLKRKRNNMKKFALLFCGLLAFSVVRAQDPFFPNTNQSLIYLNPSFAGSNGFIRNQAVYYNQRWPFVTYMNAFDAYIKKAKGGVSFSAMGDNQLAGTLKTTYLSASYAQYVTLGRKLKVVPSLQAQLISLSLDFTKLNFGDAINQRYGQSYNLPGFLTQAPRTNRINFGISSGVLVYIDKLIIGASVFSMNQPDIGLFGSYRLPMRTCVNASYNLSLNDNTLLNINAVYNNQSIWNRWQTGATLVYKKLLCGLAIGDAYGYYEYHPVKYPNFVTVTGGLHLNKINFSYSYNTDISYLNSIRGGTHQLSFSLNLKDKDNPVDKKGLEFW